MNFKSAEEIIGALSGMVVPHGQVKSRDFCLFLGCGCGWLGPLRWGICKYMHVNSIAVIMLS